MAPGRLHYGPGVTTGGQGRSLDGCTDRVAAVAMAFADLVDTGALDLPLPGSGRTRERWSALAGIAEDDLCVARLAEAHVDALAVLAEVGQPAPAGGSRWGLWAAHPPAPALTAQVVDATWLLTGSKPWCSGARACTHALVSADAPDGYRLFAVDLTHTIPRLGTWSAVGMAGSDSLEVDFPEVAVEAVGGPGDYLNRPGFWHGAMAVAACWYGGAVGLARTLAKAAVQRPLGPHALAHLGAIDASLAALSTGFDAAATLIDADPNNNEGRAEVRAGQLRAQCEAGALEVLERVGRALGAAPLCRDPRHAALAADLPVYLRQSHAESDLARLGQLVVERGATW